eukprot:scaffold218968_cov34-Tisochrysis_lutea.AAC.1
MAVGAPERQKKTQPQETQPASSSSSSSNLSGINLVVGVGVGVGVGVEVLGAQNAKRKAFHFSLLADAESWAHNAKRKTHNVSNGANVPGTKLFGLL